MSEEHKYYTPSIEEFHVGFEYEFYKAGTSEIYNKLIFDFDQHYTIEKCYEDNLQGGWIRVKYLDREDIESFGFGSYIPPHEYDHTWAYKHYILKAWFNHELPTIRIMYIPNTVIFNGTIKNKSELKVLLKQLGIE